MKAILLRRPGGPSALEYFDVPAPRPGEGEILVKADTIGISIAGSAGAKGRLRMDAAAARDTGYKVRELFGELFEEEEGRTLKHTTTGSSI
jgi:NADPH:quinone reductase-like Zn-dependent oxidoreductase